MKTLLGQTVRVKVKMGGAVREYRGTVVGMRYKRYPSDLAEVYTIYVPELPGPVVVHEDSLTVEREG